MTRALRPYQTDLVRGIQSAWARGARNVCGVMATGSGKTVVFSNIIAQEPGATVAIAHRNELVSQMSAAIAREGVRHRVIGPDSVRRACVNLHMNEFGRSYYDATARCAVAGVDTLVRMNVDSDPWFKQVGLWVCDEQHHLLAENKWGRAVAMFPNARGLGVTATPLRADGKGLGRHADGLVDEMVVGPSMRDLINAGYLTDYRIFAPPSDLDLASVTISESGDYSPPKLRAARRKSHITGDVVKHYQRIASGKLGVTFDVDVESATETAAAYRAAGVPAEVITGETPDFLRAELLRKFRSRQILQVVSVDILSEGFDMPAIEVVSMARPTQSFATFAQQFGRALRPLDGKTHAIIIDHVGNVLRHGLPDARREWTLDRRERRSRSGPSDAIPTRTCLNPECMSAYERVLGACPFCGRVPEITDRSSPERVDGDLCELDPVILAKLRGEISRIDGDCFAPAGLPFEANVALRRRHQERQSAQTGLRQTIALWAGWQRTLGRDDREGYRRFFFQFGVDVATAQTLGAPEATELAARVSSELLRHNVVASGV